MEATNLIHEIVYAISFNHIMFQDLLKAAIPELNGSIAKGEKFAADF